MAMDHDIQKTIEQHRLIHQGDHILAAVSGGADSMALLHVLDRLRCDIGCRLSVAHLHHGLRGADADADQAFVQNQAAERGIECVVGRVDIAGIARAEKISLEMAARRARYAFLADTALASGAHAIATGHTLDDQAETVLLKLSRGAGATGLGGISHESRLNRTRVIRPLRDCRRADLERMLCEAGIAWCEDVSNRDLAMLRNRMRHQVLPLLARDINPNIVEVLSRTAEILRADDACLDDLARDAMPDVRAIEDPDAIDVSALGRRPLALRRRLLRLWLSAAGVEEDNLDFDLIHRVDLLAGHQEGTQEVAVGGGRSAVRTYGILRLRDEPAASATPFAERISIPGETRLMDCGCVVRTCEWTGIVTTPPTGPGVLPAAGSLGRTAVGDSPVVVRSWRPGDRIRPTGMKGSIKLQDLYVNHKIPRVRRSGIPIFECRDEIVWIPGYRVARGWEVPGPDAPSLSLHVEALDRP